MTWIIPGNQMLILVMQKKHWMTSITQICQHPGPFQFHRRISYSYSKRGRSLLQVFTPSKFLLITWKLIFREGVVLWLSMPNIVSTDLVVFLILSYQINLWQPCCPLCFSFHFTTMPHALLTLFISMQCMAMPSILLFHFATAVQLHHVFLPFHGYAWCMSLMHAATYLVYVGTHR